MNRKAADYIDILGLLATVSRVSFRKASLVHFRFIFYFFCTLPSPNTIPVFRPHIDSSAQDLVQAVLSRITSDGSGHYIGCKGLNPGASATCKASAFSAELFLQTDLGFVSPKSEMLM